MRTLSRFASLRAAALTVLLVAGALVGGCDFSQSDGLYDPDVQGLPDPVITAVSPEGSALAGVSEVTIQGQNFLADTSRVLVYFGGTRAKLLSATPTELRVQAPNLPQDDLPVKVSVVGAMNFSNTVTYRLEPVVETFGNLLPSEEPWAIATDDDGNVYVSLIQGGTPAGILQIAPDGTKRTYTPARTWRYSALRFGPDGGLFAARGPVPILYRVPPGGGVEEIYLAQRGLGRVYDFDFDDTGNIWAGGNNASVYRVASDKTVTAFPFEGDVRAVRVHDGYLYVGATRAEADNVWRFPIDAQGNLGAEEVYYPFSDAYGVEGATIQAITFAGDGTMFVGTDGPDAILTVHPDRTWEPFYPGLLQPTIVNFAWGSGAILYAVREAADDQPQVILRINTQREGAR